MTEEETSGGGFEEVDLLDNKEDRLGKHQGKGQEEKEEDEEESGSQSEESTAGAQEMTEFANASSAAELGQPGEEEEGEEEESSSSYYSSSSSSSDSEEDDDEEEEDEEELLEEEETWHLVIGQPPEGGAEEEKRLIQNLDIDNIEIKPGQKWYLICYRWLQSWKDYVRFDDDEETDDDDDEEDDEDGEVKAAKKAKGKEVVEGESGPRPGPITNHTLLEEGTGWFKPHNEEGQDFDIIPSEAWHLFHSWYGGGPPLRRRVVAAGWRNEYRVEVRLLRLKAAKSSAKEQEVAYSCSKYTSVGTLLRRLAKKLEVDPKEVRFWDWHNHNKIKVLEDMDETLEVAQIVDQQYLLLEEKNSQGKFPPIVNRSSRPSTRLYGNTYSTSSYNYYNSSSNYYNRYEDESVEPGTVGLNNLGNTCFMNSALQCLSNTTPLTNFFLTKEFYKDLNRANPLGMKGALAEEYAQLLSELWSGKCRATAPRKFKYTLEHFAPQFSGYQQHDSQELLGFLLDGLHEDLNRVRDKPYVETKEADGREDAIVAQEAWAGHKARNNSVIVDWFQGQLKSTLVCPECAKISVTFDPFMYLSLPLPMKMDRDVTITVVFNEGNVGSIDDAGDTSSGDSHSRLPLKCKVSVPKFGTMADLKQELASLTGLPTTALSLVDIYNCRFFRTFKDSDNLNMIQDRDHVCAFEIPLPPSLKAEAEVEPPKEERDTGKQKARIYDDDSDWDDSDDDGYGSYRALTSYRDEKRNEAPTEENGLIYLNVLHRKDEVVRYSTYYSGYTSYTRKTLFGMPNIIGVQRGLTYKELYRLLLQKLARFVRVPEPEPEPEQLNEEQQQEGEAKAEEGNEEKEVNEKEETEKEEESPQLRQENEDGQEVEAKPQGEEVADGEESNKEEQTATKVEGPSDRDVNNASDDDSDADDDDGYSSSSSSFDDEIDRFAKWRSPLHQQQQQQQPPASTAPVDSRLELIDGRKPLFVIRLVDSFGSSEITVLENNDLPITLRNNQTLALCWTKEALDSGAYLAEEEVNVELHPSAAKPTDEGEEESQESVTLAECIELFTTEEKLGPDDPW
ncbi:Ubiquitin carboxyl-terminal hydrolase 15 [Balamuthia mandrillaris]